MTKEDKELLLKDLCARIPYNTIVHLNLGSGQKWQVDSHISKDIDDIFYILETQPEKVKPYLRPMSSMTDEEKKEFQACHCVYELHPDFQPMMCNLANELNMFDWLNAHHFDYRGLIEKGLALEAPEGMYKIN